MFVYFVCLLLLLYAFYVRVDTLISRNGMNKAFCSLYYVSGLFLPPSQDTLPKVCSHTGNRVGGNQK